MFSGIITAVGRIKQIVPRQVGVRLTVEADALDLGDVVAGDSIACSGVCLTVVAFDAHDFQVDVSPETLSCTTGFDIGKRINLEKALRLSDRLGGHLVSGHVDGVGEVIGFDAVGDNRELVVRMPHDLAGYVARKGSICVDGVSLTTNTVVGTDFSINLIPYTLQETTLGGLHRGARVNLEVDLLARYCERLLVWQTTSKE